MKFVSFHTHTTYSYGDGFGPVGEHVRRVVELGMSALAVSEHGNVNSHAALERECNAAGIKPIFGIEAYFGPVGEKKTQAKTHITLFAQNEEGYHNLNKLVTQSYLDAHHWPTVSPTNLRKHAKGLIAFSGCSDSLVSCSLLGGKFVGPRVECDRAENWRDRIPARNWGAARRRIQWFLDVFGPERFFLEVQRFPQLTRACTLNPAFAELGRELGVSLVATADVHYPYGHQNEMQKVLHAGRRSGSVAINEQSWEYAIELTYPDSDEALANDLVATGLTVEEAEQAILNTARIAEQCNVELPKAKPLRFRCPSGQSAAQTLRHEIVDGWRRRCEQRPDLRKRTKEYNDRIKTELKVIADKDFCDYFLVLADLVQWAKNERDITIGPGRGSAAGSVICYLLGITEIDPLHPTFQRMIFERFIDPNRTDMPDIDLDFDDSRRNEVPERAREIYGKENVANVANHVGYRARNSLKTVASAYALSEKVFEPIAKRCHDRTETDDRVDDSILDAVTAYQFDPAVERLLEQHGSKLAQAAQLEGNEHSMGIHAGGFVISSQPIPEVCAIYTKEKGQGRKREFAQVIPYEKRDAEHLGLLKMDFLGLTTMGVVGLIREWIHMPLPNLYALYYNDYENGGVINNQIMSKFLEDDLDGIFQYEGGTTRSVVRDVRPSNFDELAACNALSRPGPLYGGQTTAYIKVKRGEMDWRRIHERGFDRHVEWTYGQIVYQEQIMWILRDLAGFSTARVLRVRKIIGKKLGEHQFAELWEEFRDGCASNGVSEEDARLVWSGITTAAGYAFNTAHAYSYALVAWWSMYFKIYSSKEFFASSLSKNGDGKDDLSRRTALLQDTERHGICVEPISLIKSKENWRPDVGRNAIVPGFMQMPGIAGATAGDICDFLGTYFHDREPQWSDLIRVSGLGENTIVKMYEFSLKEDPFKIHHTEEQLARVRSQFESGEFSQFGLPAFDELRSSGEFTDAEGTSAFVGLVANVVLTDQVERYRSKTGKPIAEIQAELDTKGPPGQYKNATIFAYDEFGELPVRISRWYYEALSEKLAQLKNDYHIIVVAGRCFKNGSIQANNFWVLEPD